MPNSSCATMASHPALKLRCQHVIHVGEGLFREWGIHHGRPALGIECVLDHGTGVGEFDESRLTAQAPDATVVGAAEGQGLDIGLHDGAINGTGAGASMVEKPVGRLALLREK